MTNFMEINVSKDFLMIFGVSDFHNDSCNLQTFDDSTAPFSELCITHRIADSEYLCLSFSFFLSKISPQSSTNQGSLGIVQMVLPKIWRHQLDRFLDGSLI